MSSLRRRKRDTAENIYRNCQAWGTCPPDVKNKIEQTTIADYILKLGAGLVYFGGLGIGTGKGGTGGRFGYSPLGNRPAGRPVGPLRPRPTVPVIETVQPDLGGGEIINAGEPSVVTATDNTDPTLVDVLAEGDNPGVRTGPTQPTSVDVSLEPATRDVVTTESTHTNPVFETEIFSRGDTIHSESVDVDPSEVGTFIGENVHRYVRVEEEIELQPMGAEGQALQDDFSTQFEETVIDEGGPDSSTPVPRSRGQKRPLSLYNRRYVQVEVDDPYALSSNRNVMTFDNPAFEGEEETIIFPPESETITQSPFQHLIRLGRTQVNKGPKGYVRVSRIGQEGSIYTRSGLHIGPQKHFYSDISSIDPGIELNVISDPSNAGVEVGADANFDIISLSDTISSDLYSESDLLDHIEEVAEQLQLIIGGERRRAIQVIPFEGSNTYLPLGEVVVDITGSGDTYRPFSPTANDHPVPPDTPSITPIAPDFHYSDSIDYVIDPSLLTMRKRKKRRLF